MLNVKFNEEINNIVILCGLYYRVFLDRVVIFWDEILYQIDMFLGLFLGVVGDYVIYIRDKKM